MIRYIIITASFNIIIMLRNLLASTYTSAISSKYNFAYSNGSSIAEMSKLNILIQVQSLNSFLTSQQSMQEVYSLHWYKTSTMLEIVIVSQILFYRILLLSITIKTVILNQFTMSVLFCVILFYGFFFCPCICLIRVHKHWKG